MKKTMVRTPDRMVFEIDPQTLDARTCSHYDAYCYQYPDPKIHYIEYSDWIQQRNQQWDWDRKMFYRKTVETL